MLSTFISVDCCLEIMYFFLKTFLDEVFGIQYSHLRGIQRYSIGTHDKQTFRLFSSII